MLTRKAKVACHQCVTHGSVRGEDDAVGLPQPHDPFDRTFCERECESLSLPSSLGRVLVSFVFSCTTCEASFLHRSRSSRKLSFGSSAPPAPLRPVTELGRALSGAWGTRLFGPVRKSLLCSCFLWSSCSLFV